MRISIQNYHLLCLQYYLANSYAGLHALILRRSQFSKTIRYQ